MWVSSSPPPPAPPHWQQDPNVHLSSYAYLNPPLLHGIPISGGIVCFLLNDQKLSSRHTWVQHMLAGLKKVRASERSEHTATRPGVASSMPTPPDHDTGQPIQVWKISVPQKSTIWVLQTPRFWMFLVFGLGPVKGRERDIRKKPRHCFPGHFDKLDQLLFGIGN